MMRYSLQTLFTAVFLVCVFLGLRAVIQWPSLTSTISAHLVPPSLAMVAAIALAVGRRSFLATVFAGAGSAFLATLALAIELGEGLRRIEYFSWFDFADLQMVATAVVIHSILGAVIGAACGSVAYIVRRPWRGRSRQQGQSRKSAVAVAESSKPQAGASLGLRPSHPVQSFH